MAIDLEALYKQTQKEGIVEPSESGSKVDLAALYEQTKKQGVVDAPQDQVQQTAQPNLLNEMGKANEQVSGGLRNTFLRGNFGAGFNQPGKVERFSDTYPQSIMNLLEKTPIRNSPNTEAAAFYTLGTPAKLAGMAADTITNPLDIAGTVVGNRLMKMAEPVVGAGLDRLEELAGRGKSSVDRLLDRNSALASSREIPKLQRAEGVFQKRGADLSARAGKQAEDFVTTINNEKEALTAQVNNTQNIAKEAKDAELAQIELDYGKRLLTVDEKIGGIEKGLPQAAKKDAESIKREIAPWMTKNSAKWNEDIDKALGGSDADIFVNHQSLTNDLSSLLRSRGIDIDEAGTVSSVNQQLSAGEQKIAGLVNRISNSERAVSVRQLLKDINEIGKTVKYGKVYSPDQGLLDDAKSILAGQAEDIIPSIKDTKAWYSEYAGLRNRAFKSLDPFGGKYSTRGTAFIEKLAKGQARPEDFQFLSDLESSVGKQAGRESFGQVREQQLLEQFKTKLQGMKADDIEVVNKSLDKQITKLNEQLKKESVALDNKVTPNVDRLLQKGQDQAKQYTGKAEKARVELAKLNRLKNIVKAFGATVVTGGAGKVIFDSLPK